MTSQRIKWGLFEALALGVPVLLYLVVRLRSTMEPGDDAYITLRFATNLLAGHGYVYNVGERVLGTTTGIYPLILAIICKITGTDPVAAGRFFLLPFELVNIFLVWNLGRRLSGSLLLAFVVALLFSTSAHLLFSTLIYMEAPLFVFLMLSACTAFLRNDLPRRRAVAWVLAGLATICRPEGGILFVVFTGTLLLGGRRLRFSDIFWIAVGILPWLAWATWYFGSPLPNSMMAKRLAYLPYAHQAISYLLQQIGTLFTLSSSPFPQTGWIAVGLNLVLIGFGMIAIAAVSPAFTPIFLFALIFWILYAIANPFIFPWYVVPLEPAFYLALTYAVYRLVEAIPVRSPKGIKLREAFFVLIFAPTLIGRVSGFNGRVCDFSTPVPKCGDRVLAYSMPDVGARAGLSFEREGWYRQVADDLRPIVDEKTTILTPELGVIGYYLPSKMISSVGHVNPEVFRFLPPPREQVEFPAINHAIPTELVRAFKPDYVVSPEVFIKKSLLNDAWFKEHYTLTKTYKFGVYNYGELYVYSKNPTLPKGKRGKNSGTV